MHPSRARTAGTRALLVLSDARSNRGGSGHTPVSVDAADVHSGDLAVAPVTTSRVQHDTGPVRRARILNRGCETKGLGDERVRTADRRPAHSAGARAPCTSAHDNGCGGLVARQEKAEHVAALGSAAGLADRAQQRTENVVTGAGASVR